jgi:hypothetical protein
MRFVALLLQIASANTAPATPPVDAAGAMPVPIMVGITPRDPDKAIRAPRIDGRADDETWRSATPITGFRQWEPTEDGDPSFRTEARIAYDTRNL